MRTLIVTMLCSTVAFAEPPTDAPLANPDAHGTSRILQPGETYVATTKSVVLDEQEDISRERDRVRAHTDADFWKKVAVGSISAGAVVTVTLAVVSGMAAAHKL